MQRARHAVLIALRVALEEAIERTEHPAEQPIDQARRRILERAVRPQQLRRERRRQRQRIDRRDDRRDRNGHRELLVELAGHPAQERHRHEHRAQHQRDRHDRTGHFTHRLMRRGQGRAPFFDVALHVFHHHDRVIDDDADRQHHAEQRQRIDGKAEHVQRRKRADDGNRNGDQRNDRRAPRLQEQDHHQHDEQHGFEQGRDYGLDRIAHEDRRVVHRAVFDAGRESLRQFVHLVDDGVANGQGIGTGRLENAQRRGVHAVQARTQRVVARCQFHPRNVGQAHDLAIAAGLEHDAAEFGRRLQAALGIDQGQEVAAVRHRFRTQLTGRHLHVLFAHRVEHVAGGKAACRHLVRIEPDAHRVVAAAELLRIADAGNARQFILHVQTHVVAQVQRVVLAVRRNQMHDHQEHRRLLLYGHALAAHVLGQTCQGLTDAVLYLDCGIIRVRARLEGDGHLQHAVGPGDGLHVHHVFHAVDGFFQRRGDGLGDHFRVGAGIHGAYHHGRRHNLGIFADRQPRNRDQAGGKDHDREHGGKDRPVDEKF